MSFTATQPTPLGAGSGNHTVITEAAQRTPSNYGILRQLLGNSKSGCRLLLVPTTTTTLSTDFPRRRVGRVQPTFKAISGLSLGFDTLLEPIQLLGTTSFGRTTTFACPALCLQGNRVYSAFRAMQNKKAAPVQNRRSARAGERASTSGHGVHFISPKKSRDRAKRAVVVNTSAAARSNTLRSRIASLLNKDPRSAPPAAGPIPDQPQDPQISGDSEMEDWEDVVMEPPPSLPPPLEQSWNALLPTLEAPFAEYRQATHGQRPPAILESIHYECTAGCPCVASTTIRCLYLTYLVSVRVTTCTCTTVPVLLVRHGVFPTSPTQPHTAVSIDLLDVYRALFERSCDAITALAAALRTVYKRRGFHVFSRMIPGARATDPFREGLGNAVMRFSHLRDRARANLEAALVTAADSLFPPTPNTATEAEEAEEVPDPQTRRDASRRRQRRRRTQRRDYWRWGRRGRRQKPTEGGAGSAGSAAEPTEAGAGSAGSAAEPTEAGAEPRLTPGQAARILRERCPACFGLQEWGRPLRDGGDVQLGADGCFSYRHLRTAGDGPISYGPEYFISKEKVNRTRERIAAARKKTPAKFTPTIPQDALDACEESWDAANESKKKADPKQYDASGIFAMTLPTCAGPTRIARLLPLTATILQAYDVACVTDHSFNLFPILIDGLRERIGFIINAMHAYGHQWICQLVYSPRLRRGVGLTDQEGVERVWSRIRRLIPLTRHQWNSRRIWTIDQYIAFINDEGRDGLGGWIARQQKNLEKKEDACLKVLADCRVPETELRRQWKEQKAAQTSARSHAPARLRRDLDKVLALQTQIESVEKAIAEVKTSITTAGASANSLLLLGSLEATHETLSGQADALYASLNIHETFPQLRDLPLDFVRTLLLTRDLKINIRKRAVGPSGVGELGSCSFWEERPLGTYYMVYVFAATDSIPGLTAASIAPFYIRKFNSYCCELERLRPSTCHIPIPSPLPTRLNGLRTDPTLHEDVWIEPCVGGSLVGSMTRMSGMGSALCTFSTDVERKGHGSTPSGGNLRGWLEQELAIQDLENLRLTWNIALQEVSVPRFPRIPNPVTAPPPAPISSASRAILASASAILASPGSTIRPNVPLVLLRSPRSLGFANYPSRHGSPLAPISSASHAIVASASAILPPPPAPLPSTSPPPSVPCYHWCSCARPCLFSVAHQPCPRPPHPLRSKPPPPPVLLLLSAPISSARHERGGRTWVSEDLDPGLSRTQNEVGALGEMLGTVEVDDENEVDNENDTSGIESASVQFEICWDPPDNPSVDPSLLRDLNTCNEFFEPIDPLPRFGRIVVGTDGRKNTSIAVEDIARFQSPTGRLCGFGLNGVAAALLELFTRTGESARRALYSLHMTYPVSISAVPIPSSGVDEQHWVFVLVDVYAERIYFFDSLGGDNWRPDLRLVMLLITRLVILASRHRHPLHVSTPQETPWIARPLVSVVRIPPLVLMILFLS
ncbi:hypothetical protein B0H14DRAFT_3540522 [Mycena olivaceomarginata]|nr:hypothetical protein B0H14DRAFT_3540522 [Mycena olivaceomarginata]